MAVRMDSDDRTGQNWNDQEIELIVADYFSMRDMELRGESYVKAHRNAELHRLTGRSRGSIEFKHQNISAVMMTLGEPWIQGYKPMMNFQRALIDGVERFLDRGFGQVIEFPVKKNIAAEEGVLFIGPAPEPVVRPEENRTRRLHVLFASLTPLQEMRETGGLENSAKSASCSLNTHACVRKDATTWPAR
jgi:hypothetical protein